MWASRSSHAQSPHFVKNFEFCLRMLYSQIVLTRGLPLDLHLPANKPASIGGMSRADLDSQLQKGMESLKAGKAYTADEVDAELAREFGI